MGNNDSKQSPAKYKKFSNEGKQSEKTTLRKRDEASTVSNEEHSEGTPVDIPNDGLTNVTGPEPDDRLSWLPGEDVFQSDHDLQNDKTHLLSNMSETDYLEEKGKANETTVEHTIKEPGNNASQLEAQQTAISNKTHSDDESVSSNQTIEMTSSCLGETALNKSMALSVAQDTVTELISKVVEDSEVQTSMPVMMDLSCESTDELSGGENMNITTSSHASLGEEVVRDVDTHNNEINVAEILRKKDKVTQNDTSPNAKSNDGTSTYSLLKDTKKSTLAESRQHALSDDTTYSTSQSVYKEHQSEQSFNQTQKAVGLVDEACNVGSFKQKMTFPTNDNRMKYHNNQFLDGTDSKTSYVIYSNVIFLPDKSKGASPKRYGPKRLGVVMPTLDDVESDDSDNPSERNRSNGLKADRRTHIELSSQTENDALVGPVLDWSHSSPMQENPNVKYFQNEITFVEDHFALHKGSEASGFTTNESRNVETAVHCFEDASENPTHCGMSNDDIDARNGTNLIDRQELFQFRQPSGPSLATRLAEKSFESAPLPNNRDKTVSSSDNASPSESTCTLRGSHSHTRVVSYRKCVNNDQDNQNTSSFPTFGKHCHFKINWESLKSKQGQFARNLKSCCTNIAEDNRIAFEFSLPFTCGELDDGSELHGVNPEELFESATHRTLSSSIGSHLDVIVNDLDVSSDEGECDQEDARSGVSDSEQPQQLESYANGDIVGRLGVSDAEQPQQLKSYANGDIVGTKHSLSSPQPKLESGINSRTVSNEDYENSYEDGTNVNDTDCIGVFPFEFTADVKGSSAKNVDIQVDFETMKAESSVKETGVTHNRIESVMNSTVLSAEHGNSAFSSNKSESDKGYGTAAIHGNSSLKTLNLQLDTSVLTAMSESDSDIQPSKCGQEAVVNDESIHCGKSLEKEKIGIHHDSCLRNNAERDSKFQQDKDVYQAMNTIHRDDNRSRLYVEENTHTQDDKDAISEEKHQQEHIINEPNFTPIKCHKRVDQDDIVSSSVEESVFSKLDEHFEGPTVVIEQMASQVDNAKSQSEEHVDVLKHEGGNEYREPQRLKDLEPNTSIGSVTTANEDTNDLSYSLYKRKKTHREQDNRLVPIDSDNENDSSGETPKEDTLQRDTIKPQSNSNTEEPELKTRNPVDSLSAIVSDLPSMINRLGNVDFNLPPDQFREQLSENMRETLNRIPGLAGVDMSMYDLDMTLPPHEFQKQLEERHRRMAELLIGSGEDKIVDKTREQRQLGQHGRKEKASKTNKNQSGGSKKDTTSELNAGTTMGQDDANRDNPAPDSDSDSDSSVPSIASSRKAPDAEDVEEPLAELDDANWDAVVKLETIKCRQATETPVQHRCTVLCIDISESMQGEPWLQMKDALQTFVKGVEDVKTKHGTVELVSLVTFGHETKVALTPTTDYRQVLTTFDKLEAKGNTPLEPVLLLALFPVLVSCNNRYDYDLYGQRVRHRVILFSDGRPTPHKMLSDDDIVTDSQATQAAEDVVKKMKFLNSRNLRNIMNIYCVPIGPNPNMVLMEIIAKKSGGQVIPLTDIDSLCTNTHNYLNALQITRHVMDSGTDTLDERLLKSIISTIYPDIGTEDVSQMISEIRFEFNKEKREKKKAKNFSGVPAEDDADNSDADSDEESQSSGFESDSLTEVEGMPAIGTRVKRGPDFDPDECVVVSEKGTITGHSVRNKKCVFVHWDCGIKTYCRYGEKDKYDAVIDDVSHMPCKIEDKIKVGYKVRRGPDWQYGDQDGGSDQLGTVYDILDNGVEIRVRWDNGNFGRYRYNYHGAYDVLISNPKDPFDVQRYTHEMNRRNFAKIRGIDINSAVHYRHEKLDIDLSESLFGLDLSEPNDPNTGQGRLNKNAFCHQNRDRGVHNVSMGAIPKKVNVLLESS